MVYCLGLIAYRRINRNAFECRRTFKLNNSLTDEPQLLNVHKCLHKLVWPEQTIATAFATLLVEGLNGIWCDAFVPYQERHRLVYMCANLHGGGVIG